MGDLQSEEERDIVLELNLPALAGPIEGDPVVKAQLSYFNVITSQLDTVDCQLNVNRTGKRVNHHHTKAR
jgi:predicted secreted Zn-dependent protease